MFFLRQSARSEPDSDGMMIYDSIRLRTLIAEVQGQREDERPLGGVGESPLFAINDSALDGGESLGPLCGR
jgi:hypothetical protein